MLKDLNSKGSIPTPKGGITPENVLKIMVDEKVISFHAKQTAITIKESEIDKAVENIKTSNRFSDKDLEKALKQQGTTLGKYKENLKKQMLIRRVTNFEVSGVNVSKDEVKDYYHQNMAEFMSEEKIRVSHIVLTLTRDSDSMQKSSAEEKIRSIKRKIDSGADFAQLAREYSNDPAAKHGGDLGWFKRGKMLPDMEVVAFSLKQGEIGGPIHTPFGLHLIKVTERVEAKPIEFDKVADKIRSKLYNKRYQRKRTAWIKRLRDQAYIEILY
ncbi:Survival protein SurA precursor (Peptidyl-prolyl cis-trans isomerase SurA) [hydrothermal vent metagenome]|uniref:Survival protein SurA (Peptidyl-prolyl cis-trans isomerase SurA) n=1 Tax=hydrothermal vent metagenome TaxID=652676 RepID=A0A3B1C1G6_9ZZZZ